MNTNLDDDHFVFLLNVQDAARPARSEIETFVKFLVSDDNGLTHAAQRLRYVN